MRPGEGAERDAEGDEGWGDEGCDKEGVGSDWRKKWEEESKYGRKVNVDSRK